MTNLKGYKLATPPASATDVTAALDRLATEADVRGIALHICRCSHGDWLVWLGEADHVDMWLAQTSDYVTALITAARRLSTTL